jgi:hypothetical protein
VVAVLFLIALTQTLLTSLPPIVYTMTFLASLPFAIQSLKRKDQSRGGWSAVIALISFFGFFHWFY